MSGAGRRAADAIRVVDGLVESHLQDPTLRGRPLARLAAAVAIEHSGAAWGALLFDQGAGLEPTLKLRHDLEVPTEGGHEVDAALVAEAATRAAVTIRPGAVAAPMVLDGATRGVLYLDGLDGRGEEVATLAAEVARRIATFLRSAELVDQVARQERGLEALERLGTMLGDRQLLGRHLELAADTARASTASDFALMARVDRRGGLKSYSAAGSVSQELTAAARHLADRLAADGALDGSVVPARQAICEPVWRGSLTDADKPLAVGFLLVGRNDDRPYQSIDGTFVRALAQLLGGALAREAYFHRASVDPLTETGTRLALQLSLAEAENRRRAGGRSFALVIADLDDFKGINDRHGHPVGDEVLRGVAGLLRERLRAQDFVARYGGDEFVLVLPETSGPEAARLAGELTALVAAARFTEHQLSVSLSIGIAVADRERLPEELLAEADRALYDSKAEGRNQVTLAADDSTEDDE